MESTSRALRRARWICGLVALFAGCVTGPEPDDGMIVGLITKTEDNPFFVTMREGASRRAGELGVELRAFAGRFDGDADTQVRAIESLIAADATDILVTPSDPLALLDAVVRARRAGVLAIALDTPFDPANAVDGTFATDNFRAGFTAAYRKRDGYVTRVHDGLDMGDDDGRSVRGTLVWPPDGGIEVFAAAGHSRRRENGAPAVSGGVSDRMAFGALGNALLPECAAISINPEYPVEGPPSRPPPGTGTGASGEQELPSAIEKVVENRIRRTAERLGFSVSKSRNTGLWSISDTRSQFRPGGAEKIESRIAQPIKDVPLEEIAEVLERTLEQVAAERAKQEREAERLLREAPTRFPRLFGEDHD